MYRLPDGTELDVICLAENYVLKEEQIKEYKRYFTLPNNVVIECLTCEFRERFAKEIAERILRDWDAFVRDDCCGQECISKIYLLCDKDKLKKDE